MLFVNAENICCRPICGNELHQLLIALHQVNIPLIQRLFTVEFKWENGVWGHTKYRSTYVK